MSRKLGESQRTAIVSAMGSTRSIAREFGVSPSTVHKLKASAGVIKAEDLQTPERVARMAAAMHPTRRNERYSWDLEAIRRARDCQVAGDFAEAVRLANAIATDDAMFNARRYRVAPIGSLTAELRGAGGTRGSAVAKRAADYTEVSRPTLIGLAKTLVDHGVAIGKVEASAEDDGSFVRYLLTEWPLEFVKYDRSTDMLEAVTNGGQRLPIVHGDGVWVVIAKTATMPWLFDAAILPAAFIWPAHAESLKSWNLSADSHGLAKVWGELPQGIALEDKDGKLTPEASAFLDMIAGLVEGTQAAGVAPPGSKVNFLANPSTAWQVFSELVNNRERAAARAYTGTDAILGSAGNAPGVDISQLFGVASTLVQTDLQCISDALASGFYAPWTALNYGDSRLAPRLEWHIPDPDRERKSEESAARRTRLFDALDRYTERGMTVDQGIVDALARELGVHPIPQLAETAEKRVSLQLAPTDIARVVRVREARASQGLPLLGDERDDLMLSALEAAQQGPV